MDLSLSWDQVEILMMWAFSRVATEHRQTPDPLRALVSGFSFFCVLSDFGSSSYSGWVSFIDLSLFVLRVYFLPRLSFSPHARAYSSHQCYRGTRMQVHRDLQIGRGPKVLWSPQDLSGSFDITFKLVWLLGGKGSRRQFLFFIFFIHFFF